MSYINSLEKNLKLSKIAVKPLKFQNRVQKSPMRAVPMRGFSVLSKARRFPISPIWASRLNQTQAIPYPNNHHR